MNEEIQQILLTTGLEGVIDHYEKQKIKRDWWWFGLLIFIMTIIIGFYCENK